MKYVTVLMMIFLLPLCGCNKLKHIPFDYSYHTSVNIPAAPVVGTTVSVPVSFHTNIDSIMEAYHTKPSLLESAKLSEATLTITAPPGQSFALLRDIDIYAVGEGTPDIEIAQKHNISTTSNTLDMDVDNVELKPYLTAENMNLRVTGTTAQGQTQAMTIYFQLKVHFEANLLAIF